MLSIILFRGDWVCSLCRNVVEPEVEYNCEDERTPGEHATHGLSTCDKRVCHLDSNDCLFFCFLNQDIIVILMILIDFLQKCERLTLLILSNILSAPFHEPVSPLVRDHHVLIVHLQREPVHFQNIFTGTQ